MVLFVDLFHKLEWSQTKAFIGKTVSLKNAFGQLEVETGWIALVLIESMQEFKDGVGLACVGESWVVYVGLVQNVVIAKASTDGIFVELEQARTGCGIFTEHLFDQKKHSCLLSHWQMGLQHGQTLGKRVDDLRRKLALVHKNQMRTFQKAQEIAKVVVIWLIVQPLNDGIQSVHEVLLLHVESSTSTYFNNLENAQKPSKNVRNAIFAGDFATLFQFKLKEFSQHINQIPNDFNIDELRKLRNTQEHALKQW